MDIDTATAARLHNLYWSFATVAFIVVGSLAIGKAASSVAAWRGGSAALQRRAFWGYLFASPWILGFLIFVVGPALASLYYSFTDYRLGRPLEWIGLENYRVLIEGLGAHGRRFTQAMYNSFYYALVGVPLQIVTALGMAMLVSRPMPGIGIFRLIFYLPVILAGGPAILLAWRYMLASNGGFVNISLSSIAQSLPGLDWLYRSFIFVVEAFNAFYSGISRGDPVGAFSYLLPSLIGAAVFGYLLRGEFDSGKRETAARLAEVIAIVLGLTLLVRGLVAERIDPAFWLGCAFVAAISFLLWRRKRLEPRRLGLTFAGTGILGVLLAVRLVMIEDGHFSAILRLLTLSSPIARPGDLDYLEDVFPALLPSSAWIWGTVAVLAAATLIPALEKGQRKTLLGVSTGLLALLALGSLLDGFRYFAAFGAIAETSGSPVFHFALFRQVASTLPGLDRVPLWLQNELWAKPSLVLITMWSAGTGMLIFLAALKGVPSSLYEAAQVDGAGPVQRFFRITLPMISPAMFYNIVIGLIAALQTFEAVYIIQTPRTESSLASAAYFLYERTFRQLEIGQGAAASWILALIIVTLTVFQFRYSRWVHYEG
ncbi:MAG TPA: sugar ABC transporter permease [Trueperaceae bacterium]